MRFAPTLPRLLTAAFVCGGTIGGLGATLLPTQAPLARDVVA
jgi:hypothetical protein